MPRNINPITKVNVIRKNIKDFLIHLKYDTPIIDSPINKTGDVGKSKLVYPSANVYINTCISLVSPSDKTPKIPITNIAFAVDDDIKNSSNNMIRNRIIAIE